ncbi:MAG TPA: type II toxin-antitoxin system death-on-curing family toxin [Candidatus Acidoferrales bacterium]|jgi:death-on-curing protein|nr:type II toxin-antitoxin system death-on-curing family toxin [Candidatus Acidoferrales bacterium]
MARRIYPTVAETIATQRMLIEEFGGRQGIRDKGLLESAIFRPQSGYYSGIIEEASALMESLANNHAFIDGNKRISFVMTDAMLRANGYFLDVDPIEADKVITEAMDEKLFRFPMICAWIASIVKAL